MFHKPIYKGNQNLKNCAFTFDDGPYKLPITSWLDTLEQHSIFGTFFFTGEWIDNNPEIARMIVARGHELAPHTYYHRRMSEVSKEVFFDELKQTELAYQEATGLPCPNFFRFPYCNFNEENLIWLREWGYVDIEGNDSGDWAGIPPEKIVENILPTIDNGAILVFHCNDIAKGTPEALKQLIPSVINKGLKTLKVSEILCQLNYPLKTRSWKLSIKVPTIDPVLPVEWTSISTSDELKILAEETMEWTSYASHRFKDEEEWYQHLSEQLAVYNVEEKRELFSVWNMADHYWGFVRFGVRDDQLVILDFMVRESQADALVYMLRSAVKIANKVQCTHITVKKDMRRLDEMCRQMGWDSSIAIDEETHNKTL